MPKVFLKEKNTTIEFPDDMSQDEMQDAIESNWDSIPSGYNATDKAEPEEQPETVEPTPQSGPSISQRAVNTALYGPAGLFFEPQETGKAVVRGAAQLAHTIGGPLVEMLGEGLTTAGAGGVGMSSMSDEQKAKVLQEIQEAPNPFEGQTRLSKETWGAIASSPLIAESPETETATYSDAFRKGDFGLAARKLSTDVAEIGPQMGATILSAWVGGPLLAGLVGGSQEAAGAFEQAIDNGDDPNTALAKAGIEGVGTAVLDAIPFMKPFKHFLPARRWAQALAYVLDATTEGGTEVAEGALSPVANAIVDGKYPTTRAGVVSFWEDVKEGIKGESGVFLPATVWGLIGGPPDSKELGGVYRAAKARKIKEQIAARRAERLAAAETEEVKAEPAPVPSAQKDETSSRRSFVTSAFVEIFKATHPGLIPDDASTQEVVEVAKAEAVEEVEKIIEDVKTTKPRDSVVTTVEDLDEIGVVDAKPPSKDIVTQPGDPEHIPDNPAVQESLTGELLATIIPDIEYIGPYIDNRNGEEKVIAHGFNDLTTGTTIVVEDIKDIGRKVKESRIKWQQAEARKFEVVTPRGDATVRGRWKLMDIDDLVTSDNPDYDPDNVEGLQKRNRLTQASREQIANIASAPDARLLGNNPTTDSGGPLVDSRGWVISGNGRSLALRQAYQSGTASEYEAAVREEAVKLGLDTEEDPITKERVNVLDDIEHPVLVREIEEIDNATLEQVADYSNMPDILRMTDAEIAAIDAQHLRKSGIMALWNPSESGDPLAVSNYDFMKAFYAHAGDENMRNSDGSFNENARKRVERGVLAAMLSESEEGQHLIADIVEHSERYGMRRQLSGIMARGGELLKIAETNPELDLTPYLGEAVKEMATFKKKLSTGEVRSLEEYIGQGDLLAEPRHPAVTFLVKHLFKLQYENRVSNFLDSYIEQTKTVSDNSTEDMFSDDGERTTQGSATAADIVAALERTAKEVEKYELQQKEKAKEEAAAAKAAAKAEAAPASAPVPKDTTAPPVPDATANDVGVKEQNFTQFAKENGYPADGDVLDHSTLSPSGKSSKRAKKAAQERHLERLEQNKKAHREYEESIRTGQIVDPTGEVTKEKIEQRELSQANARTRARIAQINARIDLLQRTGLSTKTGKMRPKYQKEIDRLLQEKTDLIAPEEPVNKKTVSASDKINAIKDAIIVSRPEPNVDENLSSQEQEAEIDIDASLVQQVEAAQEAKDVQKEDQLLREAGFRAVPGIRSSDAITAGRWAYVVARGDATKSQFAEQIGEWKREGRISNSETTKAEPKKDGEQGGAKKTPDLNDPETGAINLDVLADAFRRGANLARRAFKRFLTSKGDLPESVFEMKLRRDGQEDRILTRVSQLMAEFDDAVKATYFNGRSGMTPDEMDNINKVLAGEIPPSAIPAGMRAVVSEMRSEIDILSRRLITEGAVKGEIAAIIQGNLGVYLTRTYRVFDDPDWAESVQNDPNLQPIWNRAFTFLKSENPNMADEVIIGFMKNLLYEGKAGQREGPISIIKKQGKLGAKELSIFKRREGIAPEIRALMGEYKDPRINFARSMARMANVIVNHNFLTEVRAEGLKPDGFLSETPSPEMFARISAGGNATMAPIDGLYTTKEIEWAFRRVMEPGGINSQLGRLYMKVLGYAKMGKTVGSVMTQVRNITGNIGFATANAHWNIGKMGTAWATAKTALLDRGDAAAKEYVLHLVELGVLDQNTEAGELRAMLRDAGESVDEWAESMADGSFYGKAKRTFMKIGRPALKLYQAGDNIWKVYAFENEVARYHDALPHLTRPEIEAIAANIVRNTYPTYSMVPEAVQKLRRFPLVGTFVSFPAEVVRTAYHTMALAKAEMADPRLRHIGAQRVAGIMIASLGTGVAGMVSRLINGMDRDDDEDARQFMPPWAQNSDVIYLGRGKNGFRYINMGYTDPYSYMKEPVRAFIRGDDWQSKLWDTFTTLMEPFASEDIFTQRLIDISRNTKGENGGRVFNPQASVAEKAFDSTVHVAEVLEPGTITSIRKIMAGAFQENSRYNPLSETASMVTGVRFEKVDVKESVGFASRAFSTGLIDASKLFTRVAYSGQGDARKAYFATETARRELFVQMHTQVHSAMRLGVPRNEIARILVNNGVSKNDAKGLLSGKYVPYKPTERVMQRLDKERRKETVNAYKGASRGEWR